MHRFRLFSLLLMSLLLLSCASCSTDPFAADSSETQSESAELSDESTQEASSEPEYSDYTGEVTVYTDDTRNDCPFSLSPMFGDDGVLQYGTDLKIWGKAEPSLIGRRITVRFAGQEATAVIERNGWSVTLAPVDVIREGTTLTVTCDESCLTLQNVRAGDVWLAAGQSNMCYYVEYLAGPSRQSIQNDCDYPEMGFLVIPETLKAIPQDFFLSDGWVIPSKSTIDSSHISSTAFLFARQIAQATDIPIGVVVCAYGGSGIEYWLSFSHKLEFGVNGYAQPDETCYNGMLAPAVPYAYKGVIWYQGEGNCTAPEPYASYLSAFIRSLRLLNGNPELPFLQVGLPSYTDLDYTGIRSAQQTVEDELDFVWTSLSYDTGDPVNELHPIDKLPLCTRLANLALAKVYRQDLPAVFPSAQSITFSEDHTAATVTFDVPVVLTHDTLTSLVLLDTQGNTVASSGITVENKTLTITSESPFVTVQYAMTPAPLPGVLVSADGELPTRPFQLP